MNAVQTVYIKSTEKAKSAHTVRSSTVASRHRRRIA